VQLQADLNLAKGGAGRGEIRLAVSESATVQQTGCAKALDFPASARYAAAVRKRLQIAVAVLLVVVIGVIAWQSLRSREHEPVYRGKRLTFWLRGFDISDNAPGKPNFNESVDAVRDAGTNAFPLLLSMLRASDSSLRQRLKRLAQRQHLIAIDYVSADTQQWAARQGFGALGNVAKGAVPELLEIYRHDIARGQTNSNQLGYIREILAILEQQNRTTAKIGAGAK
jgi:hypothetical protein